MDRQPLQEKLDASPHHRPGSRRLPRRHCVCTRHPNIDHHADGNCRFPHGKPDVQHVTQGLAVPQRFGLAVHAPLITLGLHDGLSKGDW